MFKSHFKPLHKTRAIPAFTGTRVMMMPIILGEESSIPLMIDHYAMLIKSMFWAAGEHKGKVCYITIDEKEVKTGTAHRRPGLHVDGVYRDGGGAWGGGGWGSIATGMLQISDIVGCRAYLGDFKDWPGEEGDCEHLREQCGPGTIFNANQIYWLSGLCVHESLPMPVDTKRAFVRLSLPSEAPWFEGYTENPLGVKPSGKILPKRKFMDA